MYKCKTDTNDFGCTVEDDNDTYIGYGTAGNGNTLAYWTSTIFGSPNTTTTIWIVGRNGFINRSNASRPYYGIRPVITIPKSIIS